jgi:hypothetical protein
MEFIAARDFRVRPGEVWKRLKKTGNLLVTSNGKPIAIMRNIEGHDIAEELKIEACARGINAVSTMRARACRKGLVSLSMEEIDKEITAARKEH